MSLIRVLALCFACAFAAQATGMLELIEAPSCCNDDGCPSDNDDGLCPPSCATCVGKVSPTRITAPLMALVQIGFASAPRPTHSAPLDGVRDDVFHPPRA